MTGNLSTKFMEWTKNIYINPERIFNFVINLLFLVFPHVVFWRLQWQLYKSQLHCLVYCFVCEYSPRWFFLFFNLVVSRSWLFVPLSNDYHNLLKNLDMLELFSLSVLLHVSSAGILLGGQQTGGGRQFINNDSK